MPFPKQAEVEIPLLKVLNDLGGEGTPQDIYPLVARYFPSLTPEEREERLPSYPSTRKWTNLVQWVRQRLVESGQADSPKRGIWRITQLGRERLKIGAKDSAIKLGSASVPTVVPIVGLRDLVNTNSEEIKGRLIQELRNLTPRSFEHFCRELLAQLGFRNVTVTKSNNDGGIDGFGDFRQGAISIRSAFQAKRWTDTPIGRPEIDRFRGAIQGDYDHGVFLTTSRFSKGAMDASYKKGAITVLLLDGAAIADLLVDRGLGVRKIPLFLYEVDDEFFDIRDD